MMGFEQSGFLLANRGTLFNFIVDIIENYDIRILLIPKKKKKFTKKIQKIINNPNTIQKCQ